MRKHIATRLRLLADRFAPALPPEARTYVDTREVADAVRREMADADCALRQALADRR